MPLKLEDLGEPTISVRVGLHPFQAMCHLRANVSIIPASLYNILDLGPLRDTNMCIEFANASFSKAIRVRENVIVMLKDCILHIDFYVIDMPEDAHVSIILG